MIEFKAKELGSERELFEKLIEDFNNISREIGSKYHLEFNIFFPSLIKPVFMNMGNFLGENVILYNKEINKFYFYGGIEEEIIEDIKEILEKLKQDFLVEVI